MPIGDLCAIGSGFFWSISIILMRVSGFKIPPLPLTVFKNCVAILCMMALLAWQRHPWMIDLSLGEFLRLLLSAALGISVADTMIASALNRLGASMQALADCAYSPSIATVGFVMFGEFLNPGELIGGALVVSGVFVGATVTKEVKSRRDLWVGFALAAGAHIIMAVGILIVRDIYREHSIVWVSAFRFLTATLMMALWVAIRSPKTLQRDLFLGFQRRDTWKTMIPMAILGPFLATLLWVAGFKYLEAGRAAIYNQLSTVFIIILAYFFLKERFTIRKAIGTALALLGSLLVALS